LLCIQIDIEYDENMGEWKKLSHVIYQCKYHIVWTPKYRYRILQNEIAEFVERKIRIVSEWKGNRETNPTLVQEGVRPTRNLKKAFRYWDPITSCCTKRILEWQKLDPILFRLRHRRVMKERG